MGSGSEIQLHESPWVPGTRAAGYYGPVVVKLFVPNDEIESTDTFGKLMSLLRDKASEVGEDKANWVVGVDVSVDPFAVEGGRDGFRLMVSGTVAHLEPLFA